MTRTNLSVLVGHDWPTDICDNIMSKTTIYSPKSNINSIQVKKDTLSAVGLTKNVRRIVTMLNRDGKAVIYSDETIAIKGWPGADAGDAIIWSTKNVPADISDEDLLGDKRKIGMTLAQGSVFRITELGPGFATPMHRTRSIDYCTVLLGELEAILDGGETIRLFPGDTFVQCGTSHSWHNPSRNERCRFMVCMIEAHPINIAGKILDRTPVWRMVVSSLLTMLSQKSAKDDVKSVPPQELPTKSRIIVSTHNGEGKAVVLLENDLSVGSKKSIDGSGSVLWGTSSVPADNSNNDNGQETNESSFFYGSSFELIELVPGAVTKVRQSTSIDYCMMLTGELEMSLAGGESVKLIPGDTAVQRGTSYVLRNLNKEISCRLMVCKIAALSLNVVNN